jgi:hypothetical protein
MGFLVWKKSFFYLNISLYLWISEKLPRKLLHHNHQQQAAMSTKPTKTRKATPEKAPIRDMKILKVNKEQLKKEVGDLNSVMCKLKKDGTYNDMFMNEQNKKDNIDTLKEKFPLLSTNLPKAFNALIEYSSDFKVDVLLSMIDKIYTIGNEPTSDINQIKVEVATLLNSYFVPSENPDHFATSDTPNPSTPANPNPANQKK